jgi:uncharacterized protein YecE (DUF72 family)
MATCHIGTCSWKYGSWEGLVYSSKKPDNYLREYASHFGAVEIDQWFWSLFGPDKVRLPDPAVVREYVTSVPSEFVFTVKVPNSITLTHFYRKQKSETLTPNPHFLSKDLFNDFLERLKPMISQIGSFIFQFEYLNKQKMESLQAFQDLFSSFISQCPEDLPYGVEIRNPNYLTDSYFHFLTDNGLHPVFLQGYYMPPVPRIYWENAAHITGQAVIRLHGPERKSIEQQTGKMWNRVISPRDEELEAISDMVAHMLSRNIDVYLNINNHFEGSAPLTIKKLLKMI